MEESGVSTSESLKEFIRSIFNEQDKGLTIRYDKEKDIFILRYVFNMNGKGYLGLMPLTRIEADNLAGYILSMV
ncbi:unnamed protein product [marine sediment metagenome]|uniref:Uncharacterized protein n=1 Tax=marine sediment metagenome TaxID=412755 RepID=X1A4W1_9ZZZZ